MATKPPRENVASTGEPGEVLATTQLQVRALGLTGALMQNITAIAPAITAFFFTATIVGFTGAISPFAYFLGFLVVLALGMCLVQLAKLFPSIAGGYFTYVSRTLGPRAGFLTGWAYTLYSPIIADPILAFFGYILQGELQANYGITFPWWVFSLIAIPVIAVLGFYGIKLSVRVIVVLGGLEFLIVLALGLSGLISPGSGGIRRSACSIRASTRDTWPRQRVSRWPSCSPCRGSPAGSPRCRSPRRPPVRAGTSRSPRWCRSSSPA